MKNIAVWTLALASVFTIVKVLKIGPVVLVISESRGYGVHVGDCLGLVPLGLAIAYTAHQL